MAQQDGYNGSIRGLRLNPAWILIWITFTGMSVGGAITAGELFERSRNQQKDMEMLQKTVDNLRVSLFAAFERISVLEVESKFNHRTRTNNETSLGSDIIP